MITDAAHIVCWVASLEIAARGEVIDTIEIEWDRRSSRHGVVRAMRVEFVREGEEDK